jgi:uncharacterized membrane protein
MRRNITIIAITVASVIAILTGIGDMLGKSDIICSTFACMKVHSSSFATAFVMPIGFYAAAFLLLALWLYLKGRGGLSATILCGLLGIESYFTFVQVFFIGSLCTICLIFFGLLFTCAILAQVDRNKDAMLTGFMLFFIAHFAFFYPSVTLKPTLTLDNIPEQKSVEIFASPSCSHCEHAIEDLRKVCMDTGTQLIVRPVSISTRDMEKSVKWVSGKLFQCGSPTSYRLAEKIVWENESEARKLNAGKLAVPLILVRMNGSQEMFRGWKKDVKYAVNDLLLGIGTAQAGDVMYQDNLRNQEEMCTGTSDCHE